jgi:hypothetical protein
LRPVHFLGGGAGEQGNDNKNKQPWHRDTQGTGRRRKMNMELGISSLELG